MKYSFTGKVEVIIDTKTMDTITLPFEFTHNSMLTRDKVKVECLKHISDMHIVYGISNITYKIDVVV